MATILTDNSFGTLASGLAVGDTTLTFTSGHGARFPTITGSDVCYVCILNSSNVLEEVIITAHTAGADTATITRAAGGTTAKVWTAGDRVEARISKSVITTYAQPLDSDLTTWAAITPGTGVATALAINIGSAGAAVTNGGALGTPTSGNLVNCTYDIGNADTTLTRVSAGVVAIEGVNILTAATGAALAGSSSQAFATAALTASSMVTATALTANGAVALKTVARTSTEDAQLKFFASNGSTMHSLFNSTFTSMDWYDNTSTKRIEFSATGLAVTGAISGANLSGSIMAPITNSLGADVALNNTANYFDGPSVAQGATGTWFVSGTVTVYDTAGASAMYVKLWDGTTTIASCNSITGGASQARSISISGYISNPVGNLRISVRDAGTTSGQIAFNTTGNSKDSTITAIRIG